MPGLPSGNVTFLFTDVEGSTRLLERDANATGKALQRHHELLREVIEAHGGFVFETIGDAVYAAFARPSDGLAAALDGQRGLMAEPWGEPGPIRVRMGLHTGEVALREGGHYFGPALFRVARLMAIGHGGQILLSLVAAAHAREQLPDGASLKDLGQHRLKDLGEAEHVFELGHHALPTNFPPLRSLNSRPHNLPVQLTSFVGRELELAEVKRLLGTTRLLTLTGAGGTGKTRLSLAAAAELLEDYPDGAWFVDLAPLAQSELVPQTVAFTLGIQEAPGRPIVSALVTALGSKTLLLVLDNCEHLVHASAQVTETLIRSCPNLRILATSREALSISGETTWGVPGLSAADPNLVPHIDVLIQFEAVRLFIDRAMAVRPTFAITNDNATAVAQICHRVDGIPLAIELAAVRVKVLSPDQIAHRLDDRFHLLTGGSRTALPRQQTLRALVDWSYDLLAQREKELLQQVSVFAGGWSLEAAEEVCRGVGIEKRDVLDLLTALVDKSLVLTDEQAGQPRYRLLETLRQYGAEKLTDAKTDGSTRDRHLQWCVGFAQEADLGLFEPDQPGWLDRVEREHDNLRSALDWSKANTQTVEAGLRLAGVGWFWYLRGYHREGRDRLLELLKLQQSARGALASDAKQVRAHALWWAAVLDSWNPELARALDWVEEALHLYESVNDDVGIAFALSAKGLIGVRARVPTARSDLLHSLAMSQALATGAPVPTRLIQARWIALYTLARVEEFQGNIERAIELDRESLPADRTAGVPYSNAVTLGRLGGLLVQAKELGEAREALEQSIAIHQKLRDKPGFASAAEAFAALLAAEGDPIRAARLAGATAALRARMGAVRPVYDQTLLDSWLVPARNELGDLQCSSAWAEGESSAFDQAVELASALRTVQSH